jgi:hypothetical protein
VPLSLAASFRLLILLTLAAHVFYMYSLARTSGEAFGFSFGTFLLATGFATIMLLPLSWAVAIAELPDMYAKHWRAQYRWKRGRCALCNHIRTNDPRAHACPECGSPYAEPEPYKLDRRAVRRYLLMVLGAWVAGIAVAEGRIAADEADFRAAAARTIEGEPIRVLARDRCWPGRGVMIFEWSHGFYSATEAPVWD